MIYLKNMNVSNGWKAAFYQLREKTPNVKLTGAREGACKDQSRHFGRPG